MKKIKTFDQYGTDSIGHWASIAVKNGVRSAVVQHLRWIPSGKFVVGSPENEVDRGNDEGPQHEVTISRGFWMFDTAVTQALWQSVMGNNPSYFKDVDRPVGNVSWTDCQEFIKKLSALKPGLTFSLPKEAQWEYACRAGTQAPFSFGAIITSKQANYDSNYPYADGPKGLFRKKTVNVKSFQPNAWGLYQMHGNVWEWCLDGTRKYTAESARDPLGPTNEGARRAARGGSFYSAASRVRAASRTLTDQGLRSSHLGLRLKATEQAVKVPDKKGDNGSTSKIALVWNLKDYTPSYRMTKFINEGV